MKRLSLILALILALGFVWAQGTEDFEEQTALTGSYLDGSFTNSVSGVTWHYTHCRDQGAYPINGKGLMLRYGTNSYLEATITGGMGNFSFQYRKAFTGASERVLDVIINGATYSTPVYGNASGEDNTIHTFSVDVNTENDVSVKIVPQDTGGRQTTIDNIVWTGYSSTGSSWSVTPTNLSGLDYVFGSGPSDYQTFTINGADLTGGYFMVSIPSGSYFEIATEGVDQGIPGYWGTGPYELGPEANHTIYARLKAGLAVGNYDEEVTVSYITQGDQGEVYDYKYVGLIGSVTSNDPVFEVSPLSLTGLTYVVGNGPSQPKYFDLSGQYLDGMFYIYPPSSGYYEISTDENDYYATDFLEIGVLEGSVQQRIYVRLVANLEVGDYTLYNDEPQSVSVVFESFGDPLEPKDVILGGSVTAPPVRHWVDFDGADEYKNSYNATTPGGNELILSGFNWELVQVMAPKTPDSSDWYEGTRSARFRGYGTSRMTMLEDKTTGAGTISFKYRYYSDALNQTAWVVEYSTDGGQNWTQIGAAFTPTDQVQTFTGEINQPGNVRLQFRNADPSQSNSNRRWNLDSIDVTDYQAPPQDYDFYDGIPKDVGNDCIVTINGSNANYSTTPISTPPNMEGFTTSFQRTITLLGTGPWTIDVTMPWEAPPLKSQVNWAAMKLNGVWTSKEMQQTTSFSVPEITTHENQEIELLLGKGPNDPTLPVELSYFAATITAQNFVQLTWTSQSESNILGYNVYRSVNPELSSAILVSPLIEGTNTSSVCTYTYIDKELEQDGTYYYWLQSVDLDGSHAFHGPISVVFSAEGGEGGSPSVPFATRLENAYPNPFNPNTNIRYQLKDAGNVKIEIFNARGQLVRSFERNHDAAGFYQINWDGRDSFGNSVSSGVYQYKMSSGKYHSTKKMVLKK